MHEPLVSIIMPLYNCEGYIRESIESVREQTYKKWELIIVDDASTDKSVDIVKQIMKEESRICFIGLNKNRGVSNARNIGTEEAKGKFIAFLDSDDLWLPTKLVKQIETMEMENILLSYGSYILIGANGDSRGIFKAKSKVSYEDMLKTSEIGTLTMVYNTDELEKHYFLEIGHEDYVMKLEVLKKIDFAKGIIEPLAKYRVTKKSLSRNKFKAAHWQWSIYRDVEKLSFLKSIYYFIFYACNGLKKYS